MKENRHILNILMGGVNMSSNVHVKLPEVMVFAGVNVARVNAREALGGHGVPEDKIRSRFLVG